MGRPRPRPRRPAHAARATFIAREGKTVTTDRDVDVTRGQRRSSPAGCAMGNESSMPCNSLCNHKIIESRGSATSIEPRPFGLPALVPLSVCRVLVLFACQSDMSLGHRTWVYRTLSAWAIACDMCPRPRIQEALQIPAQESDFEPSAIALNPDMIESCVTKVSPEGPRKNGGSLSPPALQSMPSPPCTPAQPRDMIADFRAESQSYNRILVSQVQTRIPTACPRCGAAALRGHESATSRRAGASVFCAVSFRDSPLCHRARDLRLQPHVTLRSWQPLRNQRLLGRTRSLPSDVTQTMPKKAHV